MVLRMVPDGTRRYPTVPDGTLRFCVILVTLDTLFTRLFSLLSPRTLLVSGNWSVRQTSDVFSRRTLCCGRRSRLPARAAPVDRAAQAAARYDRHQCTDERKVSSGASGRRCHHLQCLGLCHRVCLDSVLRHCARFSLHYLVTLPILKATCARAHHRGSGAIQMPPSMRRVGYATMCSQSHRLSVYRYRWVRAGSHSVQLAVQLVALSPSCSQPPSAVRSRARSVGGCKLSRLGCQGGLGSPRVRHLPSPQPRPCGCLAVDVRGGGV